MELDPANPFDFDDPPAPSRAITASACFDDAGDDGWPELFPEDDPGDGMEVDTAGAVSGTQLDNEGDVAQTQLDNGLRDDGDWEDVAVRRLVTESRVVPDGQNPYGPGSETAASLAKKTQDMRDRLARGIFKQIRKRRRELTNYKSVHASPVPGKKWWQLLAVSRRSWTRWSQTKKDEAMEAWFRSHQGYVHCDSLDSMAGRMDLSSTMRGDKGKFVEPAGERDKSAARKRAETIARANEDAAAIANLTQMFADDHLLLDPDDLTVYCRAPMQEFGSFHTSAYVVLKGTPTLEKWVEGLNMRTTVRVNAFKRAFPDKDFDMVPIGNKSLEAWMATVPVHKQADIIRPFLIRTCAYAPDNGLFAFDDGILFLEDASFMGHEELIEYYRAGGPTLIPHVYHRGFTFNRDGLADLDKPVRLPAPLRSIFERNFFSEYSIFYVFAFFGICLQWKDIEQEAFGLFLGMSRSGKSTLLKLFTTAFGGEAPASLTLTPNSERFELQQFASGLRKPFVNYDISNRSSIDGKSGPATITRQALLKLTSAEPFTTDVKNSAIASIRMKTHFLVAGNSFPALPLIEDDRMWAVANRMFMWLMPTPSEGDDKTFQAAVNACVPEFIALSLRCRRAAMDQWGGILPQPSRGDQTPTQMQLVVAGLTGVKLQPGQWSYQDRRTFECSESQEARWKSGRAQPIPPELAKLHRCIDFSREPVR